MFDLGTGLRFYGESLESDEPFRGTALVTHLHWDHVQGLPFFVPVNRPGASLDVYAPRQDGLSVADAFGAFMKPPYFPVRTEDLSGDIRFHDIADTTFSFGPMEITARAVPHVGSTNGYRIDHQGVSVAYISDHQQPVDDPRRVADSVLELCDGVDLLIHDAQYTPSEFAERRDWGHCTVEYALRVAAESGARRLALFHHDPARSDDQLDELVRCAAMLGRHLGIEEVMAAAEGTSIALTGRAATLA